MKPSCQIEDEHSGSGTTELGCEGSGDAKARLRYNGLVAGHPGDSNKTLSCRVNER